MRITSSKILNNKVVGSIPGDLIALLVWAQSILPTVKFAVDGPYAGTAFVPVPAEQVAALFGKGAGIGSTIGRKAEDFVTCEHRGEVRRFLKREFALPAVGGACIMYTREAYLADPDTREPESREFVRTHEEITHVLVDVLVFDAGPEAPPPPVDPESFVINCAGANDAYAKMTADEIRALAVRVREYWRDRCVVAS